MAVSSTNRQLFDLPRFQQQSPQPLNRRLLWLMWLKISLLYAVAVAIAGGALLLNPEVEVPTERLWYYLPIPWALMMVYAAMAFRCMSYVVREHDLSLRSGVIFHRVVIQPFTRLQHIEITRGPLERLLGLATVKLFSAGGAMHSLAVPGILLDNAERLREAILGSQGLAHEQ